jgi:hypothetical protein
MQHHISQSANAHRATAVMHTCYVTCYSHHVTAAPALVGVGVSGVVAGAGVGDLDNHRGSRIPARALAVKPLAVACRTEIT